MTRSVVATLTGLFCIWGFNGQAQQPETYSFSTSLSLGKCTVGTDTNGKLRDDNCQQANNPYLTKVTVTLSDCETEEGQTSCSGDYKQTQTVDGHDFTIDIVVTKYIDSTGNFFDLETTISPNGVGAPSIVLYSEGTSLTDTGIFVGDNWYAKAGDKTYYVAGVTVGPASNAGSPATGLKAAMFNRRHARLR